ncbi:MAG: DUF4347 domain-containing protein, partial [Pseudomonadota bacterium]|nr:DUF4347 domain-containing protein [Pseudomonadota bacterium]
MSDSGFCLALEQRILLDAAGAVTALDTLPDPDTASAPDHHAEAIDSLLAAFGAQDMQETAQDGSIAVVFVDYRVQNAEQLLDVTGHNGRVDIYTIGEHDDGAALIADVLATYDKPIDSLHIFSHGRAGELFLGTLDVTHDTLSTDNAARYLQNLSSHLSADADVLFYGCSVADGESGQRFVEKFALLSGADVAASTDLTGGAHLGGNAVLEYRTGAIEALSFVDVLGMASYDAVLGPIAPSAGGNVTVTDTSGAAVSITEDAGTPGSANIRLTPTTLADSDSNVPTQIRITSVTGGTLQTTSGAAITVGASGTVLDLTAGHYDFRFTPAANRDTAASFTYTVVDAGPSPGPDSAASTATVNITAVNDAPAFSGNATLPGVTEDDAAPSAETIATLFSGKVTDPDTGSSFSGVAIVGNDANATTEGSWQYYNGSSWSTVGSVSGSSALVLSTSTQLRFVGVADYHGTPPALAVRALDNSYGGGFSSGGSRVMLDTASNGGATAISGNTATIAVGVTNTNDAPVLSANYDLLFSDIVEDQTPNNGVLVSDFIQRWRDESSVSDIDNALLDLGIAITGSSVAGMTGTASAWQYSNDGGNNWNDVTGVSAGSPLHLGPAARIRLNPEVNQSGSATLTYGASDGAAMSSVTKTSTIYVTAANDDPTMTANTATLGEHTGTLVLANTQLQYLDATAARPYEQSPDQIVYQLTGLTTKGSLQRNFSGVWVTLGTGGLFSQDDINTGKVRYVYSGGELAGSNASDNFTFNVRDGAGSVQTGTFTVTIQDQNSALSLSGATVTVQEKLESGDYNVVNIGVSDADASSSQITFTLTDLSGITRGQLQFNGSPISVGATFTKADLDAGKLRYIHDGSEPTGGAGSHEGPTSVSFKVDITDGNTTLGASTLANQTITLAITPRNDAPDPQQTTPVVSQGGTVTIDEDYLDVQDVDSLRSRLTFVLSDAPDHGVLLLNNQQIGVGSLFLQSDVDAGKLVYRHNGVGSVDDSFAYTVRDRDGGQATRTFTIDVVAGSGFMVADDSASINEGSANVSGNVLSNDSDPDPITVTAVAGGTVGGQVTLTFGKVTIASNGSFTYELTDSDRIQALAAGEILRDSISYTATNADGEKLSATLVITINGLNDAPVAKDNTRGIDIDNTGGLTGNVLRNDRDIDRDTLNVSGFVQGSTTGVVATPTELTYGTLTLNANGSYVYTLKSGVTLGTEDQLTEVVTYTVSDGNGGTDTATLTIVISDYGIGDKTINVVEDGAPASGNVLTGEASGLTVVFVGPVDDLGDDP